MRTLLQAASPHRLHTTLRKKMMYQQQQNNNKTTLKGVTQCTTYLAASGVTASVTHHLAQEYELLIPVVRVWSCILIVRFYNIIICVETELHMDREICVRRVQRKQLHVTRAVAPPKEQHKRKINCTSQKPSHSLRA
jgi:hypothetical protein